MQSFVKKTAIYFLDLREGLSSSGTVQASSPLDRLSGFSEYEISLLFHGMGQP
jgi:hypothetical protein